MQVASQCEFQWLDVVSVLHIRIQINSVCEDACTDDAIVGHMALVALTALSFLYCDDC